LPLLAQRIAARSGDASDATVAVLRRSAAHDPGAGTWLQVDARDAARALEAVRRAVRGR
jgi:predicted kinase